MSEGTPPSNSGKQTWLAAFAGAIGAVAGAFVGDWLGKGLGAGDFWGYPTAFVGALIGYGIAWVLTQPKTGGPK